MKKSPKIYDEIYFDEIKAPGILVPSSVVIDPEYKFDTPDNAGVDGAPIIYKGYKPAEWSLTLTIIPPSHLEDWQPFADKFAPKPGLVNKPKIRTIRNGFFAMRNISRVYMTKIGLPKKGNGGAWDYEIRGLEYTTVKARKIETISGPDGNAYADRGVTAIDPNRSWLHNFVAQRKARK